MSWWVWVGLVVAAVFIFRKLKGGMHETAAATNALLAEQYLASVALVPESKISFELKNAILQVIKSAGFANMAEEAVINYFNRASRFHQLNLVAMALNESGVSPLIQREVWHVVRNPFTVSEETPDLESSSHRIKKTYGIQLELKQNGLTMKSSGVVNV